MVRTFRELVAIDSPSGDEAAIGYELERRFEALGCAVRRDSIGNLVAVLPGRGEGTILLLSTISATTTGRRFPDDGAALRTALTDGFTTAYLWAGELLLVAALIAAVAVTFSERHHDAKPVA